MPIWALILEILLYPLGLAFVYYYVKYFMAALTFRRVYNLEEGANSWDRVSELRAINQEIGYLGKRLIAVMFSLMIALYAYFYLWAIPHSKGLI